MILRRFNLRGFRMEIIALKYYKYLQRFQSKLKVFFLGLENPFFD